MLKLVPVLTMVKVCGSGSAPPYTLVKFMAFTWLITLAPTIAVTETVTLLPAVRKTSSPTKVPAISPCRGRFCLSTEMLTREGAVPLRADALIQLPPSDVLVAWDQFNVPDPPFRI